MKVLFLDVDGVLNSQRLGTPDGMRPWCVTQLARIVKESGCKIVVSSTWRAGGIGETSDFHRCLLEASVLGDDTIQRRSTGHVVPDAFTHGSAEQRVSWFRRGLQSGNVGDCDTFQASS